MFCTSQTKCQIKYCQVVNAAFTSKGSGLSDLYNVINNAVRDVKEEGSRIVLVALRSWSTEPQRSWVPIQGCGSPHKDISVTEKAGATALAGMSLALSVDPSWLQP